LTEGDAILVVIGPVGAVAFIVQMLERVAILLDVLVIENRLGIEAVAWITLRKIGRGDGIVYPVARRGKSLGTEEDENEHEHGAKGHRGCNRASSSKVSERSAERICEVAVTIRRVGK
jgi:hypothetical protein